MTIAREAEKDAVHVKSVKSMDVTTECEVKRWAKRYDINAAYFGGRYSADLKRFVIEL